MIAAGRWMISPRARSAEARMSKFFCLVLLGLAAWLWPLAVGAQTPKAGCVDAQGRPVGLLMDIAIKDLAAATMIDGRPFILYRPELERIVAMPTALFVYAHECAHQALGHVLKGATQDREKEADCWAINLLYRSALVNDAGLRVIERDVARFGAGDETHLAGPERALALAECLRRGNRWAQHAAPDDRVAKSGEAAAPSQHASGLIKAVAKRLPLAPRAVAASAGDIANVPDLPESGMR
jgi:hypothetical protein